LYPEAFRPPRRPRSAIHRRCRRWRPGDIVLLNNLRSHKTAGIAEAITAREAQLYRSRLLGHRIEAYAA
jgi:hypothetical protein